MLIDLTRVTGPRIDYEFAPRSLAVAVMDGKVTQRNAMGLQFNLDKPDMALTAGQGRLVQVFRIRPGTDTEAFHDRDEKGWEFSAWSQNQETLDYTYIVLGQELRSHHPGRWVCWFRHGQAMQKMVFHLPQYDPHDNETLAGYELDSYREIPGDGPSRYEVLGQDL